MAMLDGDIAELFSTAFSGFYLDGLLHGGTGEPVYDANGDITGYTGAGDTSVKVQTDMTSERLKASAGYADGDATLILLSRNDVAAVITITSDSEVTDGYGDRYRVINAEQDAARSHWRCHGRPV